jgi:hypothetical protein
VPNKESNTVSVVDVAGEVNSQSEAVLMDAYSQASEGATRALVLRLGVRFLAGFDRAQPPALLVHERRPVPRYAEAADARDEDGVLQLTYIPYLTYQGSRRALIEGVRSLRRLLTAPTTLHHPDIDGITRMLAIAFPSK